jgi:hypothetical protein
VTANLAELLDRAHAATVQLARIEEGIEFGRGGALTLGELQAGADELAGRYCPVRVRVEMDPTLDGTIVAAQVSGPSRPGDPWRIRVNTFTGSKHPTRLLLLHEMGHVINLATGGARGHGPDFRAAYHRLLRGEGFGEFADRQRLLLDATVREP